MDSLVIGNGLLANAFAKSTVNNCLFFCSGVSNSSESRKEAFDREETLLRRSIILHNNKCVVYFSSVSATKVDSPYFNHKVNMEKIVAESAKDYMIFRLPQVAGCVINSTLLSFMTQNIYLGNSFKVFKNATRTMIDVEDIVEIFELIYHKFDRRTILNVCPEYSFEPETLVQMISKKLNTEAFYELINAGSPQTCELDDRDESKTISDFFLNKPKYFENIVNKYVPSIIEAINNKYDI